MIHSLLISSIADFDASYLDNLMLSGPVDVETEDVARILLAGMS